MIGGGALALGGGYAAKETFLGGPDYSGPTGTVRHFFHAMDDGDTETARELTHSSRVDQFDEVVLGDLSWIQEFGQQMAEEMDGATPAQSMSISTDIEELTLEDEGSRQTADGTVETATVVAGLSLNLPQGQQRDRAYTVTADLRTEDGDWKIWGLDWEIDLGSMTGDR